MRFVPALMALIIINFTATAQDSIKTKKNGRSLTIDLNGLDVSYDIDSSKKHSKALSIEFAMLEIGINSIIDNTDYTSAAATSFLQVPQTLQNENLFSLNTGKSWNVNLYPVMAKLRLAEGKRQKIYLATGIGLQMYNFRYTKNISLKNQTVPMVILDTIAFTKNKVGLTYLSIPLQFTLKTKLAEKAWLVYGAGITGGYRISSYTKQVSGEQGKQKTHDQFNFNNFNACVTGEIGLDNYFRLFASYQLTALHETGLDQHPLSIGLRFGGM